MNNVINKYNIKVSNIAITMILTLGLVLASQFQIYITIIPITLQTLYVALISVSNPPKRVLAVVISYIALALVGLPVLSGIEALSGANIASFGFVIGFIAMSLILSRYCYHNEKFSFTNMIKVTLLANVALYICGLLWLMLLGFKIVPIMILPYLMFDIIKMGLVVSVYEKIKFVR